MVGDESVGEISLVGLEREEPWLGMRVWGIYL